MGITAICGQRQFPPHVTTPKFLCSLRHLCVFRFLVLIFLISSSVPEGLPYVGSVLARLDFGFFGLTAYFNLQRCVPGTDAQCPCTTAASGRRQPRSVQIAPLARHRALSR